MKPHLVLNDEEKQQRFDDDDVVGNGVGNVVDGDTGVQVQECAQEEGRAGECGEG